MLAKLTQAVIESWAKYHVAPEVRAIAGNATALIVSLQKCDEPHTKVLISPAKGV